MSYVKLLIFLIIAGVGGYYYYTHLKDEKPAEAATPESSSNPMAGTASVTPIVVNEQKPSELASPVLASNLPLLWNNFSITPVTLKPDFVAFENAVNEQKTKSDKLQPAWYMASQLCQQMRSICTERNAAAASLSKRQKPEHPPNATKISPSQIRDEAAQQEFFVRSAGQHWTATVPQRKKKIDALYRQLVAAEKLN